MDNQLETIIAENNDLKRDLGTVKKVITNFCKKLGLLNTDGTTKESISITALSPMLMKAAFNPSSLAKDFAELGDLMPLIKKYKQL